MLFSVIVPVYNGERYLPECLASVDAQTFDNYELVIVDDGSTDASGRVADEYAVGHSNVRVLHGPNQGPLLARRRGLSRCQGEYVVFLDADDALRCDALQGIASAIGETSADVVAYSFSRDPDYRVNNGAREQLAPGLYAGKDYRHVKEKVCGGRFNNLWGKAIRLGNIDVGASYDVYKGLMHGEDWFQLMPIIDVSTSLVQLNEALYFYRPNDSSSTARFKQRQLGDIVQVNARLREYAGAWGGNCPAIARAGEVLQYTYLLKISELSDVSSDEKRENFSVICDVMRREGVFARARKARLRPDNKLLIHALERGNHSLARGIIRVVEAAKR